jgi:hypothetical protein
MGRSLERLQETGFCTSQISILVKDQDRLQVAKLVQIEIQTILDLGATFEGLLNAVVSSISALQVGAANQDTVDAIIEGQDSQRGVTTKCLEILSSIGLSPHLLLNDVHPVVWECAVQTLELGILSYAGAHIQRFDLDLLGKETDPFLIPRRFVYHDQVGDVRRADHFLC